MLLLEKRGRGREALERILVVEDSYHREADREELSSASYRGELHKRETERQSREAVARILADRESHYRGERR